MPLSFQPVAWVRAHVRRTAVVFGVVATAAAGPARADCFDWSAPEAVIEQGALRGLPPGTVQWRIGRSTAGGVHLATSVELHWTGTDRQRHRQALFGEIQDGRAHLTARGGRLELHVTYCPTGQECRETALPFVWDHGAGHFAGANPAARAALAAACQPEADAAPGAPPSRAP